MVENVYNMLISHTNSHDIHGRSTLKDVQRDFRNGPVHKSSVDSIDGFDLICSLTSTNNMSVNSKSLNKDVKTDAKSGSMDAETNTVDISAERSALSKQRQHSIENNKAAILDTIRINLQRTQESLGLDQEYLKQFLVWKMVMLLLVLMISSLFEKTFCKVFVTFVICTASQLICSLCCTWNDIQTFSNGIGECHIFENTLYLCNTSNNNDVIVTINVQKSRSRYAKYLYYNCACVVCECHRYKRDREPSRIPEKKLRSLTRKNRNLQCYVRHRVLKNVPESSKVHRIISGVEARIKPKERIRQRKYKAFLQTIKGKVYIRKYRNISHSHDFKKVAIWFKLFHIPIFCLMNIGMQITKENILSINLVMI